MCAAPDREGGNPRVSEVVGFAILGRDECLALLRRQYLGRLAVVAEGASDIFPVNYVVDGDFVVFRTAEGTKLDAMVRTVPVAFEVDDADFTYHGGWSVVVHGRGEEVLRSSEIERLAGLPLRPWAEGDRGHWVRLPLTEVSGRRVLHDYAENDPGR